MGAAVTAVLVKERHVVDAFIRANATGPERTRTLDELSVDPSGVGFRRLRERAVVREAGGGRYYLDVEVWQAVRRTRRRVLLVMGIVILAAILFGVFRMRS